MRVERFQWNGANARELADELRALQPPLAEVAGDVAAVIEAVERRGEDGVLEMAERLGELPAQGLRVQDEQLTQARTKVDTGPLETAARNVRAVAEAQRGTTETVRLPEGQEVELRDEPVAAAAIYAPGGAAAYPSTVIMGCVPAKAAGVGRVALATPPDTSGEVPDVVLAAAEISGVDEVYAVGGAQAIAALALGTETIAPVDVIAGPGNRYVQEAKRQLVGRVGIDGIAGPSELMVICDGGVERRWIGLDLCAQAEHADDGLLVACAAEPGLLDDLEQAVQALAKERRSVQEVSLALVQVPSLDQAVELANALAPEHLQLACEGADGLAARVRYAGCVFTGGWGATAFGDYAAGSNHVLPTGGAGRFQGPLGPGTFTRRTSTVRITERAARELAPPVATLARSEGFPVHAESVEVRAEREGSSP